MRINIIYTAGYGNRTPEQFKKILEDAGIDYVIDVRRENTRARISSYTPYNMGKTLSGISYFHEHYLGNYFDDLDSYKDFILNSDSSELATIAINSITDHIENGCTVCFICCELHAYVDGKVNCHRVHVAEAVAKKLQKITGEEWKIVHL